MDEADMRSGTPTGAGGENGAGSAGPPANGSGTVTVEGLPVRRDERGWVFEPLEPHRFPRQRNGHVVWTRPGEVRGNHYHRRGTEVLAIMGPARVRYREGGTAHDVEVPEGEARRLTIPPGVPHAIVTTGSEPGILVAFNTEEHDPDDPDVVREVLI